MGRTRLYAATRGAFAAVPLDAPGESSLSLDGSGVRCLALDLRDRSRGFGPLVRRTQSRPVRGARRRWARAVRSAGESWTAIDNWGDEPELRRMPYALATVPERPRTVIAGLRGGVMLISADAGDTRMRLGVELPDVVELACARPACKAPFRQDFAGPHRMSLVDGYES